MTRKKDAPPPTVDSEAEVIRTYKVGLRVPESLLDEQNLLIVELEVLNHIHKQLQGKPSKLFSEKVSKSSLKVANLYKNVKVKYNSVKSLQQADKEIYRLRTSIKQLHWKSPLLNSHSFNRAQIPSFQNKEAPSVHEISITDYQNLANKSLKMVSKHLNDIVLSEIHKLPRIKQDFIDLAFQTAQREGKKYSLNQIKKRFEIALANITGIHSNVGRMAFYQLGMAMKAYFDLRSKVEFVQNRLDPSIPSNVDFSSEIAVILAFYSIPNNMRKYIARSWSVDSQWIRNTLVGWRRKIDPLLPIEFQVEPLTMRFTQIADSFKGVARNEADLKVISRLQGKQVLHLLPSKSIDLSPLLPENLRLNYRHLQEHVLEAPNPLDLHVHHLTLDRFLDSANELILSVQGNQARFPPASKPFKNCKTFINKINYIANEARSPEFQEILKNYVIGNRFTKNAALLLAKNSKYSRLYTALRGIIALTLAKKHASAIGHFLSAFNPDNCLTFPFTSNNRVKSHLPVNLLFNKYIVERKARPTSAEFLINKSSATKPNVTDIFREGKPIWLGLPIYAPSQVKEFQELLLGLRNTATKKGTFWFQLLPNKKIVECVQRGANVIDIRLNVPYGPVNKIVADIVLSSTKRSAFRHSGKFLSAWEAVFSSAQLPPHDILGSDFNRIGNYMVATANPDEEHDLSPVTKFYGRIHEKLEKYRKWEIPHIQRQLSTDKDKEGQPLSAKKRGRLETQITLLHRRQQKLQKEMKRQALMVYLYVAWKTKAKFLAWDAIGGISTRGQKGALAQAITYLPKQKALFEEFRQWALDLSDQGLLPRYQGTTPVSPFNSQTCGHCFQQTGKQKKTKVKNIPYDEFQCNNCGRSTKHESKLHRHSNSARVSALLLQNRLLSGGISPPQ